MVCMASPHCDVLLVQGSTPQAASHRLSAICHEQAVKDEREAS